MKVITKPLNILAIEQFFDLKERQKKLSICLSFDLSILFKLDNNIKRPKLSRDVIRQPGFVFKFQSNKIYYIRKTNETVVNILLF